MEQLSSNIVIHVCHSLYNVHAYTCDKHGDITKGNTILSKLANDENCLFINNEVTFRLQNGAVNAELYNIDGIHLNSKGTARLAENLGIKCTATFA